MKNSRPLWKMAFRNLLRNRRRTIATGTAVICGFVGLLLLGGYIYRSGMGLGASTVYLEERGHVAILKSGSLDGFSNKPWKFILSQNDQDRIQAALSHVQDKVEFTGRFLQGFGLLSDPKHSAPVLITGVEPDIYGKMVVHPNLLKWREDWLEPEDFEKAQKMMNNPNLVSITSSLAEGIGKSEPLFSLPESEREVQIVSTDYFKSLNAVDAELGITHSTGDAFIEELSMITPLKLLQSLYNTDGIKYLAIFLKDASDTRAVASELRKTLGDNYDVFTYLDDEWAPVFVGAMNFLYVMGTFFVMLIFSAVGLTVSNTTTLNLLERSRETGTLRALGYSPKDLMLLFIREAFLLGLASVGIGLLLAYSFAALINGLNIKFRPPGPPKPVQFMLVIHPGFAGVISVMLIFLVLLVTSLVVSSQARTKVVNLLSDQGA